jgi:hypothetical protein
MELMEFKVAVRADNGARGDQAWMRRGELSARERLVAGSRFIGGGLIAGSILIFVPIIHLAGIFAAGTGLVLGVQRFKRRYVIAGAGGLCPRCGKESTFFSGLVRPKFHLPVASSCSACGVAVTLLAPNPELAPR